MRRHGPVNVIVHFPKTDEGKLELGRRVAEVHADSVRQRLNHLSCPNAQKLQLLDAVIDTAKQRSAQQEAEQRGALNYRDIKER